MIKEVTYKEPASYFNADMRKAAKEFDKKQKENKSSNVKKEKKDI